MKTVGEYKEEVKMKKINNSSVNQKDRIVCLTVTGAHKFYYQPFKTKERFYLFSTEVFSGSIFAYFRDNGRCMGGRGFSLTIKEIYEDRKMYRNPKIGKIFDRLPGMIDYILRENTEQKEQGRYDNRVTSANEDVYEDHEIAA